MNKRLLLGLGAIAVAGVLAVGCGGGDDEEPYVPPPPFSPFNDDIAYGEFFADDGNVYKIVEIGNQVWMAENLNYSNPDWEYNDFDGKLPNYTIDRRIKGSWCYNNRVEDCGYHQGRLYTWEAAREACPDGWHLPSVYEWRTLIDEVGGAVVAGNVLKTAGMYYTDGVDPYGFSALLTGIRFADQFLLMGKHGEWWTSTPGTYDRYYGYSDAYHVFMRDSEDEISSDLLAGVNIGKSVRCVRDIEQ